MPSVVSSSLSHSIREVARPITGAAADYDALLDAIGNAQFVLIGEASHGTHEFYQERAAITRRLIREKGFTAVAVEADWPDAYQVNRYVRGEGDPGAALEALSGFRRFPAWMWRNAVVLDFIGWLRSHNDSQPPGVPKTGFYGLDLYSLYSSIEAVIRYLEKVDPDAARRARYRYSCFEHFGEDTQAYGYAAQFGLTRSCEDAVLAELLELQRRAAEYARRDGRVAADEFFFAEQNARLVKDAEQYYRSMFQDRVSSWNLRDRHMADTLERLTQHLRQTDGTAKVVVWEHNSHLGDARATEMGEAGEINVGQLVREQHAKECILIGFSTYAGRVTAATDWDGPAEHKRVRPALPESYEALMHEAGLPQFQLMLRGMRGDVRSELSQPRLERAIGVIYRPETERISHYFHAHLPEQFDVLLHLDQTTAVEPLERTAEWDRREPPETFPTGV